MTDKIISLTFDDGWKSAIQEAEPLLLRYGMPATFYIISDRVPDKHTEYMNVSDLRTLVTHGHEIGVHTRSHKYLTELTNGEVWYEITEGLNDLLAFGFKPRTFAYPYGEWNPYIVKQVREAGFFAARSIERGVNDENVNHLLLRAFAVREEHSLEEVVLWISEFLRNESKWLILYFHQIEKAEVLRERKWIYGTTPVIFEGILAFLKKEGVAVVTLENGMERLLKTTVG